MGSFFQGAYAVFDARCCAVKAELPVWCLEDGSEALFSVFFARLGIPMQCDFGRLIFAEKPVDLLKMQEILQKCAVFCLFVRFLMILHFFDCLKFCQSIRFVNPMYDNFATNEGVFVDIFLFSEENCLQSVLF